MADGSAYLFEGISRGAAALADGMREYGKKKQEDEFLTAQLDQMIRFAPEYGVRIDPEEMGKWGGGNINTKRAAVTGLMLQFKLAQDKAQTEALSSYRKEQQAEMKRYHEAQEGINRQRLAVQEMRLQADTGTGDAAVEPKRTIDPDTGAIIYTNPKTGASHVVGFKPPDNPEDAIKPVKYEGRLIGFKVYGPKGEKFVQARADKGDEKAVAVLRAKITAIHNKYRAGDIDEATYDAALNDLDSEAPAAGSTEVPTPTASSKEGTQENPAKPQSKSDYDKLSSGSFYIKDGQLFQKK